MMRFFWLLVFFTCGTFMCWAQQTKSMRITGSVVESDSLAPLAFVSIRVNQGPEGAISDEDGYFTLLAKPGDTLRFSSVGYVTSNFVLPSRLAGTHYSLIKVLYRSVEMLEEVTVFSFPSRELFYDTFLSRKRLGDRERAHQLQQEIDEIISRQSPSEKYKVHQVWDEVMLYNSSEVFPENNLLNPLRWSEFIENWKIQVNKQNKRGR